jgi:uncharacterized repeat protein (TIGR01451 family)
MPSRGIWLYMGARTRKSVTLLWVALFVFSLLLQYVALAAPQKALAVHDTGMFELDGNAVHNSATTPPYDWTSLFNASGNRIVTPDPHNGPLLASTFIQDSATPDQTYFTSNKDIQPIANGQQHWGCDPINNPLDKDDLLNAYAAIVQVPANAPDNAGHTVLYVGSERGSNNGTSFAGFWLLKDKNVGCTGSANFSGHHTDGDILIVSDYTNGGGTQDVTVYKWTGNDATGSPVLDTSFNGSICGGQATDNACAIANSATISTPWAPTSHASNTFVESGIDLTGLLGANGGCFTTFLAETRSSAELTATLKDFAGGQFNTCVTPSLATQVQQDGQDANGSIDLGESVVDVADLSNNSPLPTGSIDFFVCRDASAAPDCSTSGTKVGDTKTVNASGTATSDSFKATQTGFYCFRAEYTPDTAGANHYLAAAHTNKTSECFRVVRAAIDVEKTADAAAVNAGEQIGFTVTLSNSGDGTAKGIDFSDALPGGDGVNWSIDPANTDWSITGTAPNQTLNFLPTTLSAGGSSSVHVVSPTTADSCGAYPNTATVGTSNDGSDKSSASTAVLCADVSITKTADAAIVSAGQQVGFTVTITNSGKGDATGLAFTDALPGGSGMSWSLDAANSDTGWSISGSAPNQSLAYAPTTLAAGASSIVHVVSQTTNASCKAYPNTASVTTANDGSDQASATVTVNCPILGITKTADHSAPITAGSGDKVGFTVTIFNNGDGSASNVAVNDPLPAGFEWTIASQDGGWSISNGTLVWGPGTLAAHSTNTVHIQSAVDVADCHSIPNTATISQNGQAVGSDDATEAVICPELTIAKSFTGNTGRTDATLGLPVAKIGDTLTYTLAYTLTNGPVHNGVITDVLPVGLDYVAASAAGNDEFAPASPDYNSTTRTLTWNAALVTKSGTVTYQVKVLEAAAAQPQPLINTATIDSDETGPDSDQASVLVAPPPLPATATPRVTLPPTDTLDTTGQTPGNPGFGLMLALLALAALALGVGFITPVPESVRRRGRRS